MLSCWHVLLFRSRSSESFCSQTHRLAVGFCSSMWLPSTTFSKKQTPNPLRGALPPSSLLGDGECVSAWRCVPVEGRTLCEKHIRGRNPGVLLCFMPRCRLTRCRYGGTGRTPAAPPRGMNSGKGADAGSMRGRKQPCVAIRGAV